MFQYLTSFLSPGCDEHNNDAAEFERLFPYAAAWLRRRSLLREMEYLRPRKQKGLTTPYQDDRLAELEALFASTGKGG